MEPQMAHTQGNHYDQNPLDQSSGVQGEEEHIEKKSMFSRVKDRAKRVKDSIANRAHGGDAPGQDDVKDDENDQDHEEIVQEPGMHGAATAKDFAMGSDVNSTNGSPSPIPAPAEDVCPGTSQTKVTDSNSMGPDVNSTIAGPSPTPTLTATPTEDVCPETFQTKVTDSESSVPPPSAYDSVAPWDTSFDHDATSGPNGTLVEKSKDVNMPKGTLGEKFGVDSDVVTHRQGDVSPVSHQDKISDPLSVQEPISPVRHGADHDVNSGSDMSPMDVSLGKPLSEDVFVDSPEQLSEEDVTLNKNKGGHEDSPVNYQARDADIGANVGSHNTGVSPADAGVSPILDSFNKMDIHDEPKHKKESVTTGSNDHSSLSPISERNVTPESFGATTDQKNLPQDMNVDQSNTQEEGDVAFSDKPISANIDDVSSENVDDANVSGLESVTSGSHDQFSPSPIPERHVTPKSFGTTTDQNQPQDMNVDQSNTQEEGDIAVANKPISANIDDVVSENVDGANVSGLESVTSGSHDQFSPSPIPERHVTPENFGETTDQNQPRDLNVDQSNTQEQGETPIADKSISANVDDVTSENVGDANYGSGLKSPKQKQVFSSATTAVASKIGYGGTDSAPVEGSELTKGDSGNMQSEVSDATVSGLEPPKPQKSTYTGMIASKLGYGGTDSAPVEGSELTKGHTGNMQSEVSDATVSGVEPPKPQKSTYTGMLASKLGYGGTADAPIQQLEKREEDAANVQSDSADAQSGSGATGYGEQVASTADGADSAVLSKIPGTSMGTQQKTSEDADIGATDDMGMGESEEKTGVHKDVKNALQKGNTDEDMDREKENVPMGKVTESEEVANRLGSSEEERTGKVSPGPGNVSPSTGVVGKFKGAFTNWFGKAEEVNLSHDQSTQPQGKIGEEENVSPEGEKKLQAN